MLVLNWGSTAVSLPTLDSRLIFSIIKLSEKSKRDDDPTMQMLYTVFKWSLQSLSSGRWPWEDHNGKPFSPTYCQHRYEMRGKPLAGEYLGALAEIRGDWKWLRECFYMEQHYGANYVCHLCKAHKKNYTTQIHRIFPKRISPSDHG